MVQSINLVPQEEIQAQAKERAVKLSSLFTIFILVILSIVTGIFVYQRVTLSNELAALDTEISNLRSTIGKLSDIEISARNLDKKYSTLASILDDRVYYSRLLEELTRRTPLGVTIESFDFKSNVLNLTGSSISYQVFSDYVTNMLNQEYPGSDEKLSKLFTDVKINNLTLSGSSTEVNYNISVTFDLSKLKDK